MQQLMQDGRPGAPEACDEERICRQGQVRQPRLLGAPVMLEPPRLPPRAPSVTWYAPLRNPAREYPIGERTRPEQRLRAHGIASLSVLVLAAFGGSSPVIRFRMKAGRAWIIDYPDA
jgi:hypothetical protein